MQRAAKATIAFGWACLGAVLPNCASAQDLPKAWSLSGNYTIDLMGVVSGGIDQDFRYIHNIGMQLNYDGAAHGLNGITGTIGFLHNNKASINALSGDIQGISNIETGVAALRPYETWIAKTWGADVGMFKAGLIDLNANFDVPGSSALFLNPSHGINASFAQSGSNGPSIFPVLGLGLVGQAKFADAFTVRAGAFDGVPGDPDKPERTDLAWRESDGALLVGEVEMSAGKSRFVAGAWGFTQPTQALSIFDDAGRNAGAYGTLEYALSDKLSYFGRAGVTKKNLNFVQSYLGAGFVWTGPLSTRQDDQLGFAIAHARISKDIVSTGLTRDAETNFELTYSAPLTPQFTMQGDVQYVANPAGGLFSDKAVVVGIRLKFGFGD